MRKARIKRAKQVRRAKAVRRRRLQLESLESRVVLTVTPELIDINPGASSEPSDFVQIGDVTFFVATDADHGRELWKTDGTPQGTMLVKDINGSGSSSPAHLVNVNGVLFFSADDGSVGDELWMSDGTSQGTVLVKDIRTSSSDPANTSSSPQELVKFNGKLYFTAQTDNGRELWMSDGTPEGTMLVKDLFPGGSTTPNSSNPTGLTVVGSTLFFAATNDNGTELWTSDGTAEHTQMLKDIFSGSLVATPNSSNPSELTNVNGTLFFTAKNAANGTELWKSDGTADGTVLVKDIFTGTSYAPNTGTTANSSLPQALTAVGGTLFFTANDGAHGQELWKSDGTEAGTVLVKDIRQGSDGQTPYAPGFAAVNGVLFFAADDGVNGEELWKSDGTEAGTVLVKDLNPGSGGYPVAPRNSHPYHLTNINGVLYFSAFDQSSGRELWKSDGTSQGTVLVTDVGGAGDGLYPTGVVNVNGSLLVPTDDGFRQELYALAGEAQTGAARLTIYVNGQQVAIPTNVGVYADGGVAALHSSDATGDLVLNSASGVTLGSFFQTWRTNAGLAGNNANAFFSATQLMGNLASATHSVQMFVNGQISHDFENYVVQDGDQIVLVYGSDPVASLNTNFGPVVVELYVGETPITVANFFAYINAHKYDNSIFHRSVSNFVIQGGGFTTPSTTFINTSQFSSVPTDAPIQNEPGISNLRGSIAMAKLGGDPNSATSQFFFNLGDNSFLDLPQNNSFTVFGQVLDMTTVDTIAALPINTSNPIPFGELPLGTGNQLAVVQGIAGQGSITGVKFLDTNGNGVQDSGEQGIEGATIFADANNNGVLDDGEIFTTTTATGQFLLQVTPGDYVIRADVAAGQTATAGASGYAVTVEIGGSTANLNFGETPPPAPTSVDLAPSSDAGVSDSDDLTNLNNSSPQKTLQFLVSGVSDGALVRVFSDGVQIGSGTASGTTANITTNGAMVLSDGVHVITARQFLNGAQSEASPGLTINIDTVGPLAISNSAPDTVVHDQAYTFDAASASEGQSGIFYSLPDAPSGMTIDASTGVVSWTPTLAQAGPQSFTVSISDTAGNSSSRTYEVTVFGVVAAFPDAYSVNSNATLSVGVGAGVLANDNGGDVAGLTTAVVDQPTHGTLTLNADGSFTYVPDADFTGEDSFTYQATNGEDDSNVAGVKITVLAVNHAPQAVGDMYNVNADNALAVSAAQGVLKNDTDAENDPLTVTLQAGAAHGAVTLNADGSFTYLPSSGFSGADSFTYVVSDGANVSNAATVQITVNSATPPPSVFTGTISGVVYLDANSDGAVSAGESGVPGALLTLTGTAASGGQITRTQISGSDGSYRFQNLPAGTYQIVESQPHALVDGIDSSSVAGAVVGNDVISNLVLAVGQELSGNNFGEASIRPQYISSVWLFASSLAHMDATFREIVAAGEQSAGNMELANAIRAGSTGPTAPTNAAPVAGNDAYAVTANAALSVPAASGVLGNDGDSDGDPIAAQLVSTVTHGALTLNADGSFTYTPDSEFTGTDSFTYRASDGQLSSNVATVTFDVGSATNHAPVANNNAYSVTVQLDVPASGGVLANDTDADGQTLIATLASAPHFGVLTFSPNGSFVYTPDPNFSGTDTFTYSASDGQLTSNAATVTITVAAPANHPPLAVSDVYSTNGGVLSVSAAAGVLANDVDADGNALTAQLVNIPQHGTLAFYPDGSFTYTPNSNFTGTDGFTYRASDGLATSILGTVTINVSGAGNTAPTAVGDAYTADNGTLTVSTADGVLANDSDADNNGLSAQLLSAPQNGVLSFNADGSFTYTPTSSFSGTETFTYSAGDGIAQSNPATVSVAVTPPNQPPVAAPDGYSLAVDMMLSIDAPSGVLANDTDAEGSMLSAVLVSRPSHGTLTLNADGSFTYTPDSGYTGSDSFTYKANDGSDDSAETTVTLQILVPAGEPPEGEPFSNLVDQVFSEEEWL